MHSAGGFSAWQRSILFADDINSTSMFNGALWVGLDNVFRLFGIALVITAARRRDHRVQAIVSIIAFLALSVFVLIFSTEPLAMQIQ